ncbi:Orotidine 5'-phosphate decarboxylase [Buchnera aphidicola (Tetraneura ulmi)]|uniref:orotidine-5'-phosphate decarboxylase n=1 Tax=Buchnera aphidicola TaxID=9 RepID=UPI003463DD9F
MTKIILALDFSDKKTAMKLVDNIDPAIFSLKVGPVMFIRYGLKFIKELHCLNFNVFLDLKLFDIPNTIFSAVQSVADLGIWMLSVHILGGSDMLKAAKSAIKSYKDNPPLLIGVTVLTSYSNNDLRSIGISSSIAEQVYLLSNIGKLCFLDGVVCSGKECRQIKNKFGENFKVVSPGFRLHGDQLHDQLQITTLETIKEDKIDFLVLGRSITLSKDPVTSLKNFIKIISK